jgi:hypothetical protein
MKTIRTFRFASFIFSTLIFFPLLSNGQRINISTNNIISTNADQVGCWLNTHESSKSLEFEDLLRKIKIKSLRMGWQYTVMDSINPEIFHNSPCDPKVQSYNSGEDCILDENININETSDLLANLDIPGFVAISTDGVNYKGTADAKLASMTVNEREEFYLQNAIRWAKWAKNTKVKHFEIGNENDLPGEMVDNGVGEEWSGEEYGRFALKMAKAIKQVDPTIKCGINGGWRATELLRKKWWVDIVTAAPDINNYIDFVVVHRYAFGLTYSSWNSSTWSWGKISTDIIKDVSTLFPGKPLYVTEIGGFNNENNMVPHYRALVNIEMLAGVFLDPLVEHVQHWPDRWFNIGAIEKGSNNLSALGNGMAAYTMFAKPLLVANGASGKITYNVTRDSSSNSLALWLINHNSFGSVVDITLEGYKPSGINEIWTLTSPGDDPKSKTNELKKIGELAYNIVNENTQFTLSLNATSATIISFDAIQTHQPAALISATNTIGNEVYINFNQKIISISDIALINVFSDGVVVDIDSLSINEKETILSIYLNSSLLKTNDITCICDPKGLQFESGNSLKNKILNVVNNTKTNENSPIFLEAKTNDRGNLIYLTFDRNMVVPENKDAFSILKDGEQAFINSIKKGETSNIITIGLMTTPNPDDQLRVSYSMESIYSSDGVALEKFENIPVFNKGQYDKPKQSVYGNAQIPWLISDGMLLQAEHYDQGGEGISFHEKSPKEFGSLLGFRPADNVDIYAVNDEGVNAYAIGNTEKDEWLEYTIETEEGLYSIDARCALENDSAEILVLVDSVLVTTIKAKAIGVNKFDTFGSDTFKLGTKSKATLRLVFQNNVLLNYLQFESHNETTIGRIQNEQMRWFYPNPTRDFIYISNKNDYQVSISNISGAILVNEKHTQPCTLDVRSLKYGIYIIQIKAEGTTQQAKFIKQ